jgi:hypothetical protein
VLLSVRYILLPFDWVNIFIFYCSLVCDPTAIRGSALTRTVATRLFGGTVSTEAIFWWYWLYMRATYVLPRAPYLLPRAHYALSRSLHAPMLSLRAPSRSLRAPTCSLALPTCSLALPTCSNALLVLSPALRLRAHCAYPRALFARTSRALLRPLYSHFCPNFMRTFCAHFNRIFYAQFKREPRTFRTHVFYALFT